MENKLNEELLRQLLLMNFDRGKTLSEQKVIPSDRLGPQGDLQPNIKLQIPAFLKTERKIITTTNKWLLVLIIKLYMKLTVGGLLGNGGPMNKECQMLYYRLKTYNNIKSLENY